MKRRSKTQWQELFAEHESSGMTATAFCDERGLCPKYFGKRRKQLLNDAGIKATSSFVPVTLNRESAGLMLKLQRGDAWVLHIPVSVSPAWLAALLQPLQA